MKPTKEQQKIIDSHNKTIIVQSGAGTGKTSTMVEYVKHKIKYADKKPSDFCITAFTNSDVNNFKTKLNQNGIETLPDNENGVKISTMHALIEQIISQIAKMKHIDIKKDNDAIDFFEDFVDVLVKSDEGNRLLNVFFEKRLSKYKYFNQITNIYFYKTGLNRIVPQNISEKQLEHWDKFISKGLHIYFSNSLDEDNEVLYTLDYSFDLFIFLTKNITLTDSEYHQIFPYKYWLIDEIQDYSNQQFYTVFNLLSHNENIHLLGVGDIAQCIYGWRNASIEYFNKFLNKLDTIRDVYFHQLTKNFRTSENNLKIPNYLLRYNWSNNTQKTPIQLTSDNHFEFNVDDYDILKNLSNSRKSVLKETNVCFLPDIKVEYNPFEQICQIIKYLIKEKNVKSNSICVLTKTNEDIYDFSRECVNKDIKFGRKGLFKSFNDINKIVDILKKIIAYFPYSIELAKRQSNQKPIDDTIHDMKRYQSSLIERISDFKTNPYVKETPQGYEFYQEKIGEVDKKIDKIDNYVQSIEDSADSFKKSDEFRVTLSDLLSTLTELYSLAKKEDAINVRTMTDCKGEEWDYVFILGDKTSASKKEKTPNFELDFRNIEKRDAIDQQNKNYVILTRAKKVTFIQPDSTLINRLSSKRTNIDKKAIKELYRKQFLSYDALALSGIFINDEFYNVNDKFQKTSDKYQWQPLIEIAHQPLKSVTSISEQSMYPLSGIISRNQFKIVKSTLDDKGDDIYFGHKPSSASIDKLCLMLFQGDWSEFGKGIEKLVYKVLDSSEYNIKEAKKNVLKTIRRYYNDKSEPYGSYKSIDKENRKTLYKLIYYILDMMCVNRDNKTKRDDIEVNKLSKIMLKNFEKTDCVQLAEIDFMAENRLVELKCTKKYQDNHLLQVLLYWRLGLHSNFKESFESTEELEIIYPLMNIAVIIEIDKIPNSLIHYLDTKVIGYKHN